jgi:alpha-galactosidase
MTPGWIVLRRAGVAVVLDCAGPGLPRIVHWGADLGELTGADCSALPARYDVPPTVLPTRAQGWAGRPGLTGHRGGHASQPLFELAEATVRHEADGDHVRYRGVDAAAQLRLDGELELGAEGVLRHRLTLTSTASDAESPYAVEELLSLLPVPEHAEIVIDHAGRWGDEAQEQRLPLPQGGWLREQRRGRTGPDSPLLLTLGTGTFGTRGGEGWGVHLGWSGDQRYLAQRLNTGPVLLGAGEILGAGEVLLGAGESVTTPWLYGVYSDAGSDGMAQRLHTMLRRRPGHPATPRPVVLNTWEAVYFEHSYERLAALADVAAEIGVERFVVDDGWFGSRRDATSGLGDWYVSPDAWPDGLGPLAEHVRTLGMDFGLWFEPEMVNLDSELARAHPDWVLGTPGRMPPPSRNQQVLDIGRPEVFAYLLERISALVTELGIAYLKWDHNRDVADPVHRGGERAGRPALREQTLAAYRLMAELRTRHPGLEIESCSSGGGRVDLGVLEHTDRVWASDCSDPIERLAIAAGVSKLLPLELIGAHVASGRSHTTGRQHDLALRLAVATFGHSGIEWDITRCDADERRLLAEWIAFVKAYRGLLHTGELVHTERPAGDGTVLQGVVAPDRGSALFLFARLATSARYGAAPLRLSGLDPARRYRVEPVALGGPTPSWTGPGGSGGLDAVTASGTQLMAAGLAAPALLPEQAVLFTLTPAD